MKIDHPSREHTSQLLLLWETAFGEHNGFWEMFLDTAFSTDHCLCITDSGQIAAALCWFDCSCAGQKIAYVYAVVTHPHFRNRGLCRILLDHTHTHLAALGYSAVLLVPESEGLRQMYRRLGYADCTRIAEVSCLAGDSPEVLRAIGPEEYGALRKTYLPTCSVLQEGHNLDFLAQQVQFYAGPDFLLAAYSEENTLYGVELLGNRDIAPGIVTALGCNAGKFRMPGMDKPFAMIHLLTETAMIPQYFGFAFD